MRFIDELYRCNIFKSAITDHEYKSRVSEADCLRHQLQEQLGEKDLFEHYIALIEECNDIEKIHAFSDGVKLGYEFAKFIDY